MKNNFQVHYCSRKWPIHISFSMVHNFHEASWMSLVKPKIRGGGA